MYDTQKIIDAYPKVFYGFRQPEGLKEVLDSINNDSEISDPLLVQKHAYLLATVKWETAHTFLPREEIGKGQGRNYGNPDPRTRQTYYGRGLVQLTWYKNYETFGKLLNIDLLNHPELACDSQVAYSIATLGMNRGLFTGVGFRHYLNDDTNSSDFQPAYKQCRRIINGQDQADTIATYAGIFADQLQQAIIV